MDGMIIENKKASFVQLWRMLEETRTEFIRQHRCFCIRRVLQMWFPNGLQVIEEGVSVTYTWQDLARRVCQECHQQGYDTMPYPAFCPMGHREFLRAVVAVVTGGGMRSIQLNELDGAYSEVFPGSRPINSRKAALKPDMKKRKRGRKARSLARQLRV